ncbi:unnamed protein product [Lasius platythorax]|uniref:Uncharacterized protein n=1 Tax=Lasius platythorax TaxID=488582 RepID=A0AAV2NFD9_9HYME
MALPLAPVNAFEEGLQVIQEEADQIATEYPAVLQFIVYLRRVWLPLKKKVSVFGTPIRTNNSLESFHYVLSHKLGGIHPNIWKYLHNVGEIIIDQEINIGRLAEGRSVKRIRVQHNIMRDKHIMEAQTSLSLGRLSLNEFLQTLSSVSQMPEESFDLQADTFDDTLGHQEIIDSDLLDAHIVQEPLSISHSMIEDQGAVIDPIITSDNIASNEYGLSRGTFEKFRTLLFGYR